MLGPLHRLGPQLACAHLPASPLQVVFRCDVILLVGLVGLHLLASRRITLKRGVAHGLAAIAASLALSCPVDSLFWGRWLWPEGEVLAFNTLFNRWEGPRDGAGWHAGSLAAAQNASHQ